VDFSGTRGLGANVKGVVRERAGSVKEVLMVGVAVVGVVMLLP